MLVAEHLDRAEAPEAPRAYLDAALAQAAALQPERALALAERGAALAKAADDIVALNMLRGRLRCESGEGQPAIDAYAVALAATREPAERCRALIGIAAGHRLIAGVDAALAALAEAEPLAQGLARESCELHYIRGNLHFARGDNDACRAEHQAALGFAESLADPLWEVHATSGLGDADYADGRMVSALARFRRCVELCDAHGLTRAAIANIAMVGYCRTFLLEFDEGMADFETAHRLAVEIGIPVRRDVHAGKPGFASRLLQSPCRRPAVPRARTRACRRDRREAVRWRCSSPSAPRPCSRWDARTRRARTWSAALALFRETGMRFWGPMALALRARMQADERERERDRAEAETPARAGVREPQPHRIPPHRHRRCACPRRMAACARACRGARVVHGGRAAAVLRFPDRARASRWSGSPRGPPIRSSSRSSRGCARRRRASAGRSTGPVRPTLPASVNRGA